MLKILKVEESKKLKKQLHVIKGQIDGIEKMIDDERDAEEIYTVNERELNFYKTGHVVELERASLAPETYYCAAPKHRFAEGSGVFKKTRNIYTSVKSSAFCLIKPSVARALRIGLSSPIGF